MHEQFNAFSATGTNYNGDTISGWHLVATQEWTIKVVMAVLNERIRQVNNKAATGLSRANRAISNILNWCGSWDGVEFVSDVADDNEAPTGFDSTVVKLDRSKVESEVNKYGNFTGRVNIVKGTPVQFEIACVPLEAFKTWVVNLEQTLSEIISCLSGHTHEFSFKVEDTVSFSDAHSHTTPDGGSTSEVTVSDSDTVTLQIEKAVTAAAKFEGSLPRADI